MQVFGSAQKTSPSPASDKIELAIFLTKQERECFSSYLRVATDGSFQAQVIDYFERQCATNGGLSLYESFAEW